MPIVTAPVIGVELIQGSAGGARVNLRQNDAFAAVPELSKMPEKQGF